MSVVMDTNILVNALFHNDRHAQKLLSHINHKLVNLYVSEEIVNEYVGIILLHAIKANLCLDDVRKPLLKLSKLLMHAKAVNPQVNLSVAIDADDNKFFNCAHEADVDIIISQDNHLKTNVEVVTYLKRKIKVLTPWQYFQNKTFI